MKKTHLQILFLCGILFFCTVAFSVDAATLEFDPQDKTVGMKESFDVGLNISATEAINALELTLKIPPGLTPIDVKDGNSVISFWIEEPHFDEYERTLTLSGIMTGGFHGTGGRVALIVFKASSEGKKTVTVDTLKSRIFLNTGDGIADTVTAFPLDLFVSKGRDNILNHPEDTVPPEPFTPLLSNDPLLYSGRATVVFSTQDKDSGVDYYEVAERRGRPISNYEKLVWQRAESPFLLHDQEGKSAIYIRAVDNEGNSHVEVIPASVVSWYLHPSLQGILYVIIGLVAVLFIIWKKTRKKSVL